MTTPTTNEELFCTYTNKVCRLPRTRKRNGSPHRLCELHRDLANRNQRRSDAKRRRLRREAKCTTPIPIPATVLAPVSAPASPMSVAIAMATGSTEDSLSKRVDELLASSRDRATLRLGVTSSRRYFTASAHPYAARSCRPQFSNPLEVRLHPESAASQLGTRDAPVPFLWPSVASAQKPLLEQYAFDMKATSELSIAASDHIYAFPHPSATASGWVSPSASDDAVLDSVSKFLQDLPLECWDQPGNDELPVIQMDSFQV